MRTAIYPLPTSSSNVNKAKYLFPLLRTLVAPIKKRIILISSDGTQYTILQDDFPGDLVAKCGLPISNNSKNRCIATIVAELIVEDDQLILKGKEIKQITKISK